MIEFQNSTFRQYDVIRLSSNCLQFAYIRRMMSNTPLAVEGELLNFMVSLSEKLMFVDSCTISFHIVTKGEMFRGKKGFFQMLFMNRW